MSVAAAPVQRAEILVQGVVQGVGFRPFVHRLAVAHGLTGQVANVRDGVAISVAGPGPAISAFCAAIERDHPAPARISRLDRIDRPPVPTDPPWTSFRIAPSSDAGDQAALPPPDLDLCDRCHAELLDPADRRHRYPFITCTACGPRFTLVRDLPIDRERTAMDAFPLCPTCAAEYDDPNDRRFHAQAICCPACGPALFLHDAYGADLGGSAPLTAAIRLLREGKIVAIKGVGGFHLAVDAANEAAVARLRARKGRPAKPLALMAGDLASARRLARLSDVEAALLTCPAKPIVLLAKRTPFPLPANIAPANHRIGVMLPYTPLHHLLFAAPPFAALVMTSGNRSGEPIFTGNQAAMTGLAGVADAFLLHDREIIIGCDDAVQRVQGGRATLLRTGRGTTPRPLPLAVDCGATLALGGRDKNTVCLTRGHEALLSQHIGDLDQLATMERFSQTIRHLETLCRVSPDLLVHDLHPDYPSSRHAAEQSRLPTVAVQHHHAHAASCMAEHGLTEPVLALTLDGSGYGPDGSIWGGELLLARLDGFERLGHLRPIAMPGGDMAVREPYRMAASLLTLVHGIPLPLDVLPPPIRKETATLPLLAEMIAKGINAPLTSSCGRLFDGVAALLGLCSRASFDGEAAMALEAVAAADDLRPYPVVIDRHGPGPLLLDSLAIVRGVLDDLARGVTTAAISGRFHGSLAALFGAACRLGREKTGLNRVVCSGGVFQNQLLNRLLTKQLETDGFTVYTHHQVPANDGGLALGQAVVGRSLYRRTATIPASPRGQAHG